MAGIKDMTIEQLMHRMCDCSAEVALDADCDALTLVAGECFAELRRRFADLEADNKAKAETIQAVAEMLRDAIKTVGELKDLGR